MRAAIRRSDAESYILTSLVASAATVIVTRVFLELAAYPQLGNSILHIALALWGGLLLFVVTGFRGLGLALREVGNERNPPVPIDNAVVLCEVMRALDARMAGTFREVLSHTACGRLRLSVERIVRSAVGWRERAMREVGHMLRVYVTTACVALTLVTGGAVSTDSGATQPVDGLYAQGTKRQRGASGSDLWSPALPPVCSSCSCSTFMLFTDESFLVGHNLDNGRPVPGTIVVNKRNVQKTGVSLHELLFGVEPPNPAITWTSRYGSITFNAWGKEFIDGGINEVGLYIHEMSLLGTRFPEDDERPRMFMMQWMQYQLDNYATVEEVLSNLSTIVLDGWFWHFFVSDREGNTAAIEFVDGVLTVYTGDSMPIPVLCNTAYPEELANLERYAGFGGEQPVRLRDKRTERFVHAAHMIQNAPQSVDADYVFRILKTLERGLTQWSIVIDVNQGRVYFRTSLGKKIKYVDLARFDFSSDTPVKMLDINARLSGDVLDYFVDYSPQRNLRATKEGIESTDSVEQGLSRPMAPHGYTLDDLIDRACTAANGGSCAASPAGAETAGGVDAIAEDTLGIAEDALSKPGQTRNWLLWPLGAVLAVLLSASLLLVHRNRRRPPEETAQDRHQ